MRKGDGGARAARSQWKQAVVWRRLPVSVFVTLFFASVLATPLRAADIVKTVSTAEAHAAMRETSLPAVVAGLYRTPSPSVRALGIADFLDYALFDDFADRRMRASAALRRQGWSAAMVMAGWDEAWKTLPGGLRADEVPLAVAIEHAMEACRDAMDDVPAGEDVTAICGRRVAGDKHPQVEATLKAMEACARGWFDSDPACLYELYAADYENALFDPSRAPLSMQIAALERRRPSPQDLDQLGETLTGVLEMVRASLPADEAPACPPAPVRVKIVATRGGEDGLNVTAAFCTRELEVPLKIVEDIWARSLFRAMRFYETTYGENLSEGFSAVEGIRLASLSLAQPASDAEAITITAARGEDRDWAARYDAQDYEYLGVYARSLQSYLDLLTGLPPFEYRTVFAGDLLAEMRRAGDPALLEKWSDLVERSEASPTSEATELLSDFADLEELAADLKMSRPDRARDAGLARYIAWLKDAEEISSNDAFLDNFRRYAIFQAELALISQVTHTELLKSYLFIMAHESWHIWMRDHGAVKPTQWAKDELAADAHAARVYLAAVGGHPDVRAYFAALDRMTLRGAAASAGDEDEWVSVDSMASADPMAQLFGAALGRDPDLILKEIFGGTRYERTGGHPPLELRTATLRRLIAEGRAGLNRQAIDFARCLLEVGLIDSARADATCREFFPQGPDGQSTIEPIIEEDPFDDDF